MRGLFRRLRYMLNRSRFDRELADEMEFHREMAAGSGNNFGDPLRLREQSRDAWGWTWIDRLSQDLHYAFRKLRRSPGFTFAAVLMLAIGLGVNVAAFSFFDLLVLRPLPVREPETLLRFHRSAPQGYSSTLPYPEMEWLRQNARTLSAVLAISSSRLTAEGEAGPIEAQFVTTNLFQELGAAPALGRLLDPSLDGAPGAEPVVVLAHGFWQRHFGSDPQVVGRLLRLNNQQATIVGVASPEFTGLSLGEPALWVPITRQPDFVAGSTLLTDLSYGAGGVLMWGRRHPGITPGAVEQELRALAAELRHQHPSQIWENESLASEPGGYATSLMSRGQRSSGSQPRNEVYPIFALIGALSLLILTVACANLGSLLLARGIAREREITIRAAVGAGRARLIRQLLTESVVLALLGSAAGLASGYAVLRILLGLTASPRWLDPSPDWRISAFAVAIGFFAALLFGLAPAFQIVRQRHRATATRQFLVGAQIASSCLLLIVAGLLVRALNHATTANPGFEYERVLAINPGLSTHSFKPARAQAYLDALQARLLARPGVESVSLALSPPLGQVTIAVSFQVDGRDLNAQMNYVTPEFFETMRIPVLRGRNLRRGETQAIVVSESFARSAWPGLDPIGRRLDLDDGFTVIGVVGSARTVHPEDSDSIEAYLPIGLDQSPSAWLLVRSAGPPEYLARAVSTEMRALEPGLFPEVYLVKDRFSQKLDGAEKTAIVVGLIGSIAHLLACLGILGVVAYAVSQRTKEIGIRIALGAKPWQVLATILRQFLRPVGIGLIVGVGAATALARLLRGSLYGVSHLDPLTYVSVVTVSIVTVAIAALGPARRVLRVDPLHALRHE